MTDGMRHLNGAIDAHVHTCPHINGRRINLLESVRQAASAGMRAIGLMDNFQNSSGYAALAMAELGHLGVDVFGGLIMQPTAGGISYEAARNAVDYGYGPGTGARFVSLPTHHTRAVALRERRSPAFLETTFCVPASGRVPEPVPAIMELCAERDIVFDCGHVDGKEAVALAQEARRRGVTRLRTHCGGYDAATIAEIAALGGYCEFSFFALTHATQVGLTHADPEQHRIAGQTIQDLAPRIRAAGDRAIVSSDAGIVLLAPPVESFRQFMLLLESEDFDEMAIRRMNSQNPAALFGIGAARPTAGGTADNGL
ncbi:MAG: DUF6282 family protein [Hyphomicrobiales bacterium]|jgi:hypothetical protein|nr:DUF6282 family protein [Hyphomicrobiales bacterium]